jgi:hypothetical protein
MAEQRIQINLPPDKVAGVFADFVQVWHTSDSFVMDFAALASPVKPDDETGDMVHNAAVVSRVRIPPSQVFELMKALNTQLTAWENEQKSREKK